MYAIHFVCSACGKHLEVDEAGAGLVIRCTDCDAPLRVPEQVAKCVCPHCHVAVLVAANLVGQDIECSTCRRTFAAQPPAATAPRGLNVHFKCPACGKHLEVDEAGVGLIVQCPDCGAPLKVPHKTARFVCPFCESAVLVAENLWGQSIECATCFQPILVQDPNAPLQHACPFCYYVVMVDRNRRGQFVECPACRRQFHVPNPDVDVEQGGRTPEAESLY